VNEVDFLQKFEPGVYTELFRPVVGSRTGKVECTVCGKDGYPGEHPKSWMNAHKRGHSPCPDCGKQLTLLTNGRPRTHQRCPERS
jgi:uncharacterized Zn-finger protein